MPPVAGCAGCAARLGSAQRAPREVRGEDVARNLGSEPRARLVLPGCLSPPHKSPNSTRITTPPLATAAFSHAPPYVVRKSRKCCRFFHTDTPVLCTNYRNIPGLVVVPPRTESVALVRTISESVATPPANRSARRRGKPVSHKGPSAVSFSLSFRFPRRGRRHPTRVD
jgi:hypothetical protein